MVCERCGKRVVAPMEYGDFFICSNCNYEDNFKNDRYPEYNEHDEVLERYRKHTNFPKDNYTYARQSFRLKNF